jgi:hypothetical protein
MAIDRTFRRAGIAALAVAAIAVAATSCDAGSGSKERTPLPAEKLGAPRSRTHDGTGNKALREVIESEPSERDRSEWARKVQQELEREQGGGGR